MERLERDEYGLKSQEDDSASSSSSTTDDEDYQSKSHVKESGGDANPDELIRVYENEMKKWQPWWTDLSAMLIESIDESDSSDKKSSAIEIINKTLIENSKLVNVSHANEYFYHEILQTSYLYVILVYVYQLDEDDLNALANNQSLDVDLSLVDEMCSAFLEINKLLSQHNKVTDLRAKFDLIIASLLQEEKYFLKVS